MAMGERPNAGRAVSMVASEPTTMIDSPHIRMPLKDRGQTVDEWPRDHSCAQSDQSGTTRCDDNTCSHHEGAVQYGYGGQLLRVCTSD